MTKKQKNKYKIFGAIITIVAVFGLGSMSMDTSNLLGRLTLDTNIQDLNPSTIDINIEDVSSGEEIELNLFDENSVKTSLPEKWYINLSYYQSPIIETTIGSTNPDEMMGNLLFIQIEQDESNTYKFNAPEMTGLYKIALYDDQDNLVGVLTKLNVRINKDVQDVQDVQNTQNTQNTQDALNE